MENKIVSIKLSEDFKKEIIFNALCNGVMQLCYYGIYLDHSDKNKMEKARKRWKEKNPNNVCCIEDIYMSILENNEDLYFVDEENDEVYKMNLQSAFNNLDNLPIWVVNQLIDETDDGETADVVLQYCLFNEIIFG